VQLVKEVVEVLVQTDQQETVGNTEEVVVGYLQPLVAHIVEVEVVAHSHT
jgi:hypothetical protein